MELPPISAISSDESKKPRAPRLSKRGAVILQGTNNRQYPLDRDPHDAFFPFFVAFWDSNLRVPTKSEETELLHQVQVSSGSPKTYNSVSSYSLFFPSQKAFGIDDDFNIHKLQTWFKRRRKQMLEMNADAPSVSQAGGLNSPAPTISPTATSPNAPFHAFTSPGASTSRNGI